MGKFELLPLGQKFFIDKEKKIRVDRFLAKSRESLMRAMLLEKKDPNADSSQPYNYNIARLEKNLVIKIVGFSSNITGGNWPSVKVAIYPRDSKMANVYFSMNDLEGLEWRLDAGAPELEIKKKPARTIFSEQYYHKDMEPGQDDSFISKLDGSDSEFLVDYSKLDPNQTEVLVNTGTSFGDIVHKSAEGNGSTYRVNLEREDLYDIIVGTGFTKAVLKDTKTRAVVKPYGKSDVLLKLTVPSNSNDAKSYVVLAFKQYALENIR